MWSVISRVGQLLGLVNTEPNVDLNAIAAILDEPDSATDAEYVSEVPEADEGDGVRCQHRVGAIAELHDTIGYIKNSEGCEGKNTLLSFRREDGPSELEVGNKVVYLAFRLSEEHEWTVRKILQVVREIWDGYAGSEDELNSDEPVVKEECDVAYKHVIAKVSGRQGRTVLAGELQFSLDSVQIDFIPIEGDWVVLESLVQTEERADTVLKVDRVRPLRVQTVEGKVTHWSQEILQGIINAEVVFAKDACQPGYLPRPGDQVRFSGIESEQGGLTWRALSVLPISKKALDIFHDPEALRALLANKQGVTLTEDTNCGVVNIGQEKQTEVEVINNSDSSHVLLGVEFVSDDSQFKIIEPPSVDSITFSPQKRLRFVFKVKGRFVGVSTELVIFHFEGFDIARQLVVDVQNPLLSASLQGLKGRSENNTKHSPITAQKMLATRNGFILPGRRPVRAAHFIPVELGMFKIPDDLTNLVLGSQHSSRTEDIIGRVLSNYSSLREPLSKSNYTARWDLLIHLEELEQSINLARYNTVASFQRVRDYLSLDIPGLAERRPSLVVNDKVIAVEVTNDSSWSSGGRSIGYQGFIHKVLSNEVLIKFNVSFHETCSGMYNISFESNRTSFRREHRAVREAWKNLTDYWLFPSRINYKDPQIVITAEEDYVNPWSHIKTDSKSFKETINKEKLQEVTLKSNMKSDSERSLITTNEENPDNNLNMSSETFPNRMNIKQNILEIHEEHKNKVGESQISPNLSSETSPKRTNIKENVMKILKQYENNEKEDHITKDIIVTQSNSFEADAPLQSKELLGCSESTEVSKSTKRTIIVPRLSEQTTTFDECQVKISPSRPLVISRFLQNGNCSAEKSPKDVKNMLQRLASISNNENKLINNQEIKTLEEIEKSLLNSCNKNAMCGVSTLPETNEILLNKNSGNSAFEQFLKASNLTPKREDRKQDCQNVQAEEHNYHKTTSERHKTNQSSSGTPFGLKKEKLNWNNKIDMKLGEVRVADFEIPKIKWRKVTWFNPQLNHYQKEAVKNILRGEARPLPYVIFGPPGTGKTITLVETILQIYFLIPESRILVGAPSNSAADLVCERLLDAGLLAPGDLLRLVAFSYASQGRVPERLRPYCGHPDMKDKDDGMDLHQPDACEGVVNLSRQSIGRHRITVGTCNSLGVLYQMGFPKGHFTHVLVDEAGQATEPEILIPFVFLHSSYGQSVLAGDPLQLGPVVLSKVADQLGLGESLLSRILRHNPYCRDLRGFPDTGGYNPHLITRLVYNYRSLPQILALPNTMFYDGDLIPQVSDSSSEEALVLARLRGVLPGCAMVFHGVRGTNCQAQDSPSWYNPHEVVQATRYLQLLYDAGLTPNDCGIITPYQAQAIKIRQMLETLEIPLPKVGSVEEFQGQERMAVILSTVRSSPRLIESDLRHTVGFVASPRRLNVAITRARAVLIIVGNPHLLARDQYWRSVLEYCVRNNGYTGCDRPPLDNDSVSTL